MTTLTKAFENFSVITESDIIEIKIVDNCNSVQAPGKTKALRLTLLS